jgi:hypothetical protein
MLVVDPWHWLCEDGSIPTERSTLRKNVLRVARLIEYGGPLRKLEGRETLVECTGKFDKKPCPGFLWVVKNPEDHIHAFCTVCKRDDTLISNWHETEWAKVPMEPFDLSGEREEVRLSILKRLN